MSGLEIAAAVFGVIAGTIDLIHKSVEIYGAVKDKSGIPKALRKVSDKLPSIEELLRGAQAQYKEGQLNQIDNKTWENAKQEIERCNELCLELHELLLSVYPEAGSGRAGRLWIGTKTVFSGKGKSAEALFREVWGHLDILAKQQIINNTALLEEVRALVQELCAQSTTVSMQNIHGDNFTGDKTEYNNTGSGPMINGASGPISLGGT